MGPRRVFFQLTGVPKASRLPEGHKCSVEPWLSEGASVQKSSTKTNAQSTMEQVVHEAQEQCGHSAPLELC